MNPLGVALTVLLVLLLWTFIAYQLGWHHGYQDAEARRQPEEYQH